MVCVGVCRDGVWGWRVCGMGCVGECVGMGCEGVCEGYGDEEYKGVWLGV